MALCARVGALTLAKARQDGELYRGVYEQENGQAGLFVSNADGSDIATMPHDPHVVRRAADEMVIDVLANIAMPTPGAEEEPRERVEYPTIDVVDENDGARIDAALEEIERASAWVNKASAQARSDEERRAWLVSKGHKWWTPRVLAQWEAEKAAALRVALSALRPK
jgi:hypothetical protein